MSYFRCANGGPDCHWEGCREEDTERESWCLWCSSGFLSQLFLPWKFFSSDSALWSVGRASTEQCILFSSPGWWSLPGEQSAQHRYVSTSSSHSISSSTTDVLTSRVDQVLSPLHFSCHMETFRIFQLDMNQYSSYIFWSPDLKWKWHIGMKWHTGKEDQV